MTVTDQLKQTVGRAIGRIPSGVFILTARDGAAPSAALVSWVQQAAFDPPSITVALARGRSIGQVIRSSERFALSVLGQDDTALMKRFARGVSENEDAFAGLNVIQTPSSLPVLADALAYLDCRLLTVCDFDGDHELFIAAVTDGKQLREGSAFMHQRGNGFHY